MTEVTRILHAIAEGDPHAASQLLPLVYDELRQLAAIKLGHETPGQTLQPTALVHEAYLRLVGEDGGSALGLRPRLAAPGNRRRHTPRRPGKKLNCPGVIAPGFSHYV